MFSGKLNKLRTFALSLCFIGIFIMYIGFFFKGSMVWMGVFMVLGFLTVLLSSATYFWIGMLSTRAVRVECPTCGKITKMLGKNDECMFCKQKLTLEPEEPHHD